MARIRSIKPEFWTSEQVVECSVLTRLMFIGLWSFCDDHGIHPLSLRRIKMEIFPADDVGSSSIRRGLVELSKNGLIRTYVADNTEYLQITGWTKHQRIDRPTYKYPEPTQEQLEVGSSLLVESSTTEWIGEEWSGVERSGVEFPSKGGESLQVVGSTTKGGGHA